LETGSQDCTILVWSDNRARIVERGELVASHPMGVIARKGVKITQYADLKGKTISVLRGLAIEPRFDADPDIIKDADSDYILGVRKMAHQRVDVKRPLSDAPRTSRAAWVPLKPRMFLTCLPPVIPAMA